MATRHLYNVTAVGATLLHALEHGDDMLAIQTAKEIYVSEEHVLLQNLLNLAWFLSPPEHPQQKNRYEAFITGDPLQFLVSLLGSPAPIPVAPVYDSLEPPKYGTRHPPTTWQKWPIGWTAEQAGALYYTVEDALKHGNWRRAAYLTVPFMNGNMLAIAALLTAYGVSKPLVDALCTTIYVPLCQRIVEHAYASLTANVARKPKRHISVLTDNTRGERTWSVSPQGCATWSVRTSPTTDLMGSPVYITKEPTEFWRRALAKFAVTAEKDRLVVADDKCEEFYETYFPSDIPDEWSTTERSKSHGFTVPLTGTINPWTTAFLLCWS